MTPPTIPSYPRVTQTPKPKQITGDKTLFYKKCTDVCLYTFCLNEVLYICIPDSGLRGFKIMPLIQNG